MKLRLLQSVLTLLLLGGCVGPAKEELPALMKQLHDRDSHVRSRAAMSLARLASDAEQAVPRLIALLKDPNGGVRSSAAYALRAIGTPAAIKALDSYAD